MLKRSALRPRNRNAPRPEWKVNRSFLGWLRKRPCACEGRNPDCDEYNGVQAAHAPHKASKGVGTKVDDRFCIPLSNNCHNEKQHRMGWPSFAKEYLGGRDPLDLASDYFAAWKRTPSGANWTRD